MTDKIVVFYSRADENYVNGMLKNLEVGNTEVAAGIIQKFTEADIFKMEQLQPYSPNYNECIAQAQADQKRNARPELKNYPESIEEYDIIYLGFPNYWGTMPMAVFTFLEHFDFSVKDIQKLCSGAIVTEGIAIRGGSVERQAEDIEKWIRQEEL